MHAFNIFFRALSILVFRHRLSIFLYDRLKKNTNDFNHYNLVAGQKLKLGIPKYETGMQTNILLCPTLLLLLLLLLLFTAIELQKGSTNNKKHSKYKYTYDQNKIWNGE